MHTLEPVVFNKTEIVRYEKGESVGLSAYLKLKELDCRCRRESCRFTPVSKALVNAFTALRVELGVRLIVTSGYRCPAHNFKVGGHSLSWHQLSLAVDVFYSEALENKIGPYDFMRLAKQSGFKKVKFYDKKNFFHLQIVD